MTSLPNGDGERRRPVPDGTDLRLLSALAAAPSAGLPQLAWQAGMSQQEAAARLVTMNEAGLPLRLVAEGEPAALWQIVQRGPAPDPRSNAPAGPASWQQSPQHDPYQAAVGRSFSGPQPGAFHSGSPSGRHALPGQPEAEVGPIGWPVSSMSSAPPTTPATPATNYPASRPDSAMSPQSMWGIPGTAAWASRDTDSPSASPSEVGTVPPPTEQQARSAEAAATALAERAAGPTAVPPVSAAPSVGSPQRAAGLSGEQLTVTVTEVIDPGNDILTAAGFRLDDTERAVLVRTTVANNGPAPHDCMPDLYLFLVAADGTTLPKAPVAIAGHPAHRVGVAAGTAADGWTIFLIEADAALAGVRWCVRPDLADRTLTWSVGPADPDTGAAGAAGPAGTTGVSG